MTSEPVLNRVEAERAVFRAVHLARSPHLEITDEWAFTRSIVDEAVRLAARQRGERLPPAEPLPQGRRASRRAER